VTRRGRCSVIAATILVLVVGIEALKAQGAPRTEYEIKAAYLYSFGRFVEWPSGGTSRANPNFAICVLGVDPFGAALDTTLAGATMRGQKVVGKRIVTAKEAVGCHVLFISASEAHQLGTIVRALDKVDVLTVSDIPQFAGRGGMIQFVTAGNKVRFEINLTPAQDARLTLSSDLLRVASAVRRERPPAE